MPNLKLTLACWDYDRTRPLMDGRVKPDGIELDIKVLRPRQCFLPRPGLYVEHQMLAQPHPPDLAEAQSVQRAFHCLPLGIEQRRAGHHANLDAEGAQSTRPRGSMPRERSPISSAPGSPSVITIGPAISASSPSLSSSRNPRNTARSTP